MNPNKTISVNSKGFIVNFTDTKKHHFVRFKNDKFSKETFVKTSDEDVFLFNHIQQKMYAEALYGLNVYTEEEIQKIPKNKVLLIVERYNKTQKLINRLKQEIINDEINKLLLILYPKSKMIKTITSVNGYDDSIKSKFTFKEVGLNQQKIASKLVEFKILPNNFFQLKDVEN